MHYNFVLVKVDSKYCDYLRKFDNKVVYNKNNKELRPFIGVILKVNEVLYFAPLSSPKIKHLNMKDNLDFMKINHGNLGVVNFNNMIPVLKENYTLIDLNNKPTNNQDLTYYYLLLAQLSWLNAHRLQVIRKATHLYDLYITNKLSPNIKKRCCNFPLLEEKCINYKPTLKV